MKKTLTKVLALLLMLAIVLLCFPACALEMFTNFLYLANRIMDNSFDEFYIYETTEELENMGTRFCEYGSVEKYAVSADEFLNGLEYENQYLAKYECEEYSFEIFAYEFKEAEQAQIYYNTSMKEDNDDGFDLSIWHCYSYSSESGEVKIIVINETDVYRINYPKKSEEAITALLSQSLSLKIIDIDGEKMSFEFECVENEKYIGASADKTGD